MKPHFHKVPVELQSSFNIMHKLQPDFGSVWHFHPELELHYIIKGEGVRFIGDNIDNFSAGEMILLGENLPHTWRCKEDYFQGGARQKVEAIVIQFLPYCLGRDILNLPEAYLIPKLYEKAKKGLVIKGEAKKRIADLMTRAVEAKNLDRLILLLSVIKELAETEDIETITSEHVFYKSNEIETERLNRVCSYTLSNFKKEISLEEISSVANLSITSFCRYFKMMTKKTYNDFLTEIKISHACRALVEDKLSTEVICFDCGFNNVSNFYRHFKKVMNMTPLEYKRKYLNT
ncbi:AraC family transcriptional regulator [Rufibacter tibetensis]|uniref:AraC family transcriptional regulator n=1 Tax=Rufibacter tibetensis TaxID=512763 RepID=A0A0P0CXV7_9BACT|nr:AraC family transcriptional regulator [Rufibacter tibetensis]ALJ01643.1 AraC family transcriptional regulator [Rufibacter tibetensis]